MNERQCTDEHIEASARPDKQLQPEVPSITRALGARTDEWKFVHVGSFITNDEWIRNIFIYKPSESAGFRESAT